MTVYESEFSAIGARSIGEAVLRADRRRAAAKNKPKPKPRRTGDTRPRLANQGPAAKALIGDIAERPSLNAGVLAMRERAREFPSDLCATLAGIAVVPEARAKLDAQLDKMWEAAKLPSYSDEVVVGGGLHAAIYCAVRKASGFPPPLVIEAGRVGGSFAVSREAAFYLNSRNRPGELSLPGLPGALNVLPAGVIQPAHISGDEYQRNTDLAFCIRASLAMNARVVAGVKVTSIGNTKNGRVVTNAGMVSAGRVVIATGLGSEVEFGDGSRALSFRQFMAAMDKPFPLRGMRRVAVVGAGDSGRTAIEALCGQGPTTRWSAAALDWPGVIDWYGMRMEECTRETWSNCNRSRYKNIERLLPDIGSGGARVTPRLEPGRDICSGYECAYVSGRPYDYAIVCTGYLCDSPLVARSSEEFSYVGQTTVAGQGQGSDGRILFIGPVARLPVSSGEERATPGIVNIPESRTALFRYAGRTAALAADLPAPS